MKGETKMKEIDWKKKLTSRKFWAAVCSLVAQMVVAFGGTDDQSVKITALIMAGATVIAYIIGEGLVDAANKNTVIHIPIEDVPPDEEEIVG
jgi:hypothetical protein